MNDTEVPDLPLPQPLETLISCNFGSPLWVRPLPLHASRRQRWRIGVSSAPLTAIAVYNPSTEENAAFVGFTEMFRRHTLPVPQIYDMKLAEQVYLEEDLGSTTLYDVLLAQPSDAITAPTVEIGQLLRSALDLLARFQVLGSASLDTSLCYQGAIFDTSAVGRDLHRFEREFLRRLLTEREISGVGALLSRFSDCFAPLLECRYFMYRDFQSRNIMVRGSQLTFIDYQSGRLGPPDYDAVSFLYQARINLNQELRDELYEHYLGRFEVYSEASTQRRREYLPWFVSLRALQTLGAYGELGLGQGKTHFVQSIPQALDNLVSALREVRDASTRDLLSLIELVRDRCRPA